MAPRRRRAALLDARAEKGRHNAGIKEGGRHTGEGEVGGERRAVRRLERGCSREQLLTFSWRRKGRG